MQDIVAHLDAERKFGFIRLHPRLPAFFFDFRHVIGEPIKRGDIVSFWLDDSRTSGRGLVALEVQRLTATTLRQSQW